MYLQRHPGMRWRSCTRQHELLRRFKLNLAVLGKITFLHVFPCFKCMQKLKKLACFCNSVSFAFFLPRWLWQQLKAFTDRHCSQAAPQFNRRINFLADSWDGKVFDRKILTLDLIGHGWSFKWFSALLLYSPASQNETARISFFKKKSNLTER